MFSFFKKTREQVQKQVAEAVEEEMYRSLRVHEFKKGSGPFVILVKQDSIDRETLVRLGAWFLVNGIRCAVLEVPDIHSDIKLYKLGDDYEVEIDGNPVNIQRDAARASTDESCPDCGGFHD